MKKNIKIINGILIFISAACTLILISRSNIDSFEASFKWLIGVIVPLILCHVTVLIGDDDKNDKDDQNESKSK